jgi:hypothetical protein
MTLEPVLAQSIPTVFGTRFKVNQWQWDLLSEFVKALKSHPSQNKVTFNAC